MSTFIACVQITLSIITIMLSVSLIVSNRKYRKAKRKLDGEEIREGKEEVDRKRRRLLISLGLLLVFAFFSNLTSG